MNNTNDIANAIFAELAVAADRMRDVEQQLNQDPNNWELQAEFEEAQQVCWTLEGDLENWCKQEVPDIFDIYEGTDCM